MKEARIRGGIHFRTACDVDLADYAMDNFLLPLRQHNAWGKR